MSYSFLLHQMFSLFSTINRVGVLEINIFSRDYSNLNNLLQRYNIGTCARFTVDNWDNIR